MKESLRFLLTMLAITAGTAPFAQLKAQAVRGASGQTAPIAQALVGITQSNGTLPCVGDGTTDCYGIPSGAVALQPNMFISPGVSTTWYAVFQTGAWSGSLSVTFDLVEAGVVAQSATGSATAGGNSTVLVTVSQSAPSNGYNGAATLAVSTAATPTGGGAPARLNSSADIQVGTGGAQIAVAMAGISQSSIDGPPCLNNGHSSSCFFYPGVPIGAAVVWPDNVTAPTPGTSGIWYAILQSGDWKGEVRHLIFTLIEQGSTVMTYPGGGGDVLRENYTLFAGVGELPAVPNNGYVGPAAFTVTGRAGESRGGGATNLKYSVPIQVLPAAP